MTNILDPTVVKVLIVDDMPNIRDFMKTQLKQMGFSHITEAKDGYEALLHLKNQDPKEKQIELIISDWNMPKMSGLELLKEVRQTANWYDIVFILITGETDRDQITEAILSGISQYIMKPVAGKAFEEKVRAAWGKQKKKG